MSKSKRKSTKTLREFWEADDLKFETTKQAPRDEAWKTNPPRRVNG